MKWTTTKVMGTAEMFLRGRLQTVAQATYFIDSIKLQRSFVYLSVCLCPHFFSTRLSDRNQIWHTYAGRYGTHSQLKKIDPPNPRGVFRGSKNKSLGNVMNCQKIKLKKKKPGGVVVLGGQKIKSPGNVMNCRENQNCFFNPPPPEDGGREGEGGRQGRRGPSEGG